MKRMISVVLTMSILLTCFALPVLADEVDDNWIEFLDYGYDLNNGSNYFVLRSSSLVVQYKNPTGDNIVFYDIIFMTDAIDPRISTHSEYLTVISLGNKLYRAFGVSNAAGVACWFNFECTSGSWLQILSFKGNRLRMDWSPINVIFSGFSAIGGAFPDKHFTNTGYVTQTFTLHSYDESFERGYFGAEFHFTEDWKKYDYIDLTIASSFGSIDSFCSYLDGVSLPVSVSPISYDSSTNNAKMFNVRIDLSSANRSSSGYPFLEIMGRGEVGTNEIALIHAYGLINVPSPSVWTHWFSSLFTNLNNNFNQLTTNLTSSFETLRANLNANFGQLKENIDNNIQIIRTNLNNNFDQLKSSIANAFNAGVDRIVAALMPDVNSDSFQDKLDSSLGQLGDAGAAMDNISRPDIGNIDLDVTSRIPVSGMNAMASIVNLVYQNEVLGPLMWMFFTLSLGAFVLFGRS